VILVALSSFVVLYPGGRIQARDCTDGLGFPRTLSVAVEGSPRTVVVADLNGDGWVDLTTANWRPDGHSVLLGNGDGTFQDERSVGPGCGDALITADFDGDGRLDLVTGGGSCFSVLLGNGDGTFQQERHFDSEFGPNSRVTLVSADVDGDGWMDLATASSGSGDVSVLLGTGGGEFLVPQHFGAYDDRHSIVMADLDGDGRLDLASTACDHSGLVECRGLLLALLNDCEGPHGGQRPGDANQDGRLNISDAVWFLGHLFLGEHPALPCEGRTAAHPGPGELALLDGNGDKRLDLSDVVHTLLYLFRGGDSPILGIECRSIAGCPDRCREK
jgi:hypothetical protein